MYVSENVNNLLQWIKLRKRITMYIASPCIEKSNRYFPLQERGHWE